MRNPARGRGVEVQEVFLPFLIRLERPQQHAGILFETPREDLPVDPDERLIQVIQVDLLHKAGVRGPGGEHDRTKKDRRRIASPGDQRACPKSHRQPDAEPVALLPLAADSGPMRASAAASTG